MAILKEGQNCWRIIKADAVAFLIDAAAYYEALVSAVEQAKESIYIAGWDIDSRIQLLPGNTDCNGRRGLGEFLNQTVSQTKALRAYILIWDYPAIYAREREWLPLFNLGWKTHKRIHFRLDGEHPIGASQHQKFVVVDDEMAFCGGIDLTRNRWDTPEHRIDDPCRMDTNGKPYAPFHDIQMAVSGEAAAALGELFRERWRWATGKDLQPKKTQKHKGWPEGIKPDLTDVQVGIARTLPAYKSQPAIREIEVLHCEAIAAAEASIYIENQYLTSNSIAQALAESLQQDEGPEIIVVLPEHSSGWLEQSTMDAIRTRILNHLQKVDRHKRLRVVYPALGENGQSLYVHSKIMVVDDLLAVVSSANLSNRSMGLDSECALVVESEDNSKTSSAVAAFRNTLLAEHLATSPAEIEDGLAEKKSLIRLLESSSDSHRTLRALKYNQDLPMDGTKLVPAPDWLDPEKPVEFDRIYDHFVRDENAESGRLQYYKIAAILLILLGLAAAWRWTPLADLVNMDNLTQWALMLQDSPLLPVVLLGAYAVSGLIMVPITLMIGATAIIFSTYLGVLYALAGCLLNSLVTYSIGAKLGRETVRKLAGRRLNRLSKRLAKQGLVTVAVIRNIPVAPFAIVSMVAGASHINLKDFLAGTALGMLPGILAITVFADRLIEAVKEPGWINIAIVAGVAVFLVGGAWMAQKRLSPYKDLDTKR